MPHRRVILAEVVANDLLDHLRFHARRQPLPPDLRTIVDPDDPALDFIVDELDAMRAAGFDMTDTQTILAASDIARRKAAMFRARREAPAPPRDPITLPGYCGPPVLVYYARLGNRVKIGWSSNVAERMRVIQPEELMATEPGGRVTEGLRHEQFKTLRVVGEWFRYEGSLVDHISRLRGA